MAATPVMRVLTVAALAALSVPALASPVEVEKDRIVLHDEFIPRFTDLPRVLVVPAGETVTLPPDSTWDAIEVAGTLRVSRDHDTVCRFIHLTILPGGTLDMGTDDDPVLRQVEFIVRDVPIDTKRDPYQWGNGLINLGHQSRVGRLLERTWTELAEDAEAGATTLRVDVPEGWQVGDELFLPDLRQIRPNAPIRRESTIRIAAIDGDTITLSKPLDFEHRSIRDPDGSIVVRPRVANLTRNIVIRSENPDGTRGHTVNTGAATWDIRYTALVGLGRTQAENLDSTTADPETGAITHIGTNQIARYTSHDHHVHRHGGKAGRHHAHGTPEAYSGRFIGNVLRSAGASKWGHVVHGTHDTLVEENVALGFAGAGFVTEDGYEVRNVFRRNVAALSEGNGVSAIGNVDRRRGRDCPGCEGAGFWFRGLKQTIEGNEAWNNAVGINLFAMDVVKDQLVPGAPGTERDTPFEPGDSVPVSIADNVTLSNSQTGHEQWGTTRFPVDGAVSAHNQAKQAFIGVSVNPHMWLRNVTFVASGGVSSGVSSSAAYVSSLEVEGGRIVGCGQAFQRGGARQFFRLRNLTLQCATNINFRGGDYADESTYDNVLHKPLGDRPKRYLVLGNGKVWKPGEKVPPSWARDVLPSHGTRHFVKNWQGTGRDFRLYEMQQLASAPALPATGARGTTFYCPEAGLTMGECWNRYGLGYQGGPVPDDEAVSLDGLANGVARAGLTTTLGVPRAVLMTPNMIAPAPLQGGRNGKRVRLQIALTGDPEQANGAAVVQIDGRRPERVVRGQGQPKGVVFLQTDAVSEGTHTVRTWREDPDGDKIRESELTFQYFVPGATAEKAERQPELARSTGGQRIR